ncbi:AAA family ATPase [Rhodopila sp.]|uniref:AAA family ATPase n=1 Tax=Rhodopila sp. TaxID=2480087 RepID=UPI003D13EAD6
MRVSNLLKDSPDTPLIPNQVRRAESYLDLYGLSKPPFERPSDSSGYILFHSHRPVFERLLDHMINGSGMAVLSGDEGSGKSEMLAAAARAAVESGLRVIKPDRPSNRRLDRAHLLAAILGRAENVSAGETDRQAAIRALLGPPRSVLVLDDGELLTAECQAILMAILEQGATGIAIVLTLNPGLHPIASQPHVVRLARTQLQIPRLGAAEVRQYIEHGLWIAGGTTRRLIAPDALRLIIPASNGVPGSINRLMEAVFTAGFARGDALITARTVASVVAPSTDHGRKHRPRRTGVVIQAIAVAILLIGMAAFLYRGLSGSVPTDPPIPADGTTRALMKGGARSLDLGDVAGARLFFQHAAEAGDARAATAVAKTYDPAFQAAGTDPVQAADWYRKAIELGDPQARDLLKQLGSRITRSRAP